MRMRPSLSKESDGHEIFDDSTLTEIAHLICGDETPLLYWKGYEIAVFFQRVGWDDVPEYDGTPRHKWARELMDRLAASPDGRVINTGSMQYRKGHIDLDDLNSTKGRYRMIKAYGTAELGTVLFTQEFARRVRDKNVTMSAQP